jgi:hypothetical protein
MQVTAVATPRQPDWRWRIVNNAGEIIEESHQVYPSVAAALAKGTKRLVAMNTVDRSERRALTRRTPQFGRRPKRRT